MAVFQWVLKEVGKSFGGFFVHVYTRFYISHITVNHDHECMYEKKRNGEFILTMEKEKVNLEQPGLTLMLSLL